MAINPGYMGYADIGGNQVRFTDANIAVKQQVETPDLIMGDWDHNVWHYGKIEVGGTINGPITENFVNGQAGSSLWQWATKRDTQNCGGLIAKDVNLYYYCSGANGSKSRRFPNMFVNSLNFSCSAGDVANFSLDVMGYSADAWDVSAGWSQDTLVEKIVTWDNVGVTIGTLGSPGVGEISTDGIQSFDFTIANNLEAVYAIADSATYYPFDIVPGLRSLTGSLSLYNIPGVGDGASGYSGFNSQEYNLISFNIGGESYSFRVRFHRIEPSMSVGPIVSTVAFTGVGSQTALDGE